MRNRNTITKGFTLIELMVTMALVAILMAVAVPSMRDFQRNSQLTAFANTMLATINAAKSEAMKRGRSVVIVPLSGSDWKTGMIVFVDMDNNRTYDSATDVLIQNNPMTAPDYLTVTPANGPPSASPPYMRFDAQGYAKPAGSDTKNFTLSIVRNDVTGSEVPRQTRYLKVATTGRARICTPASSSDATCSAASTS